MAKKSSGAVILGEDSANITVTGNVRVAPGKLHFRDSELVGRSKPVPDEDVIALADSMNVQAGGSGQQQPLQVRAMHTEGEYEIIFGNTRKRAGDLIVGGYKSNDGKDRHPQPYFTLRCEVVDVDDATAFKRNVVENVHRNATSPIDNAVNQQILREKYNMSDVAISRLYGYSSSASVHRLKKLLNLPADMQDQIHAGTLTLQAAVYLEEFLAKEGPESLMQVWNSIHAPGENENDPERLGSPHIGATEVSDAIKKFKTDRKTAQKNGTPGEQPAADNTDDGVPPVTDGKSDADTVPVTSNGTPGIPEEKGKSLTLKQVKVLLEDMSGGKKVPAVMKTLAANLLNVINGSDIGQFVQFVQEFATDEDRAEWDRLDTEEAAKASAAQPAVA